MKTHTLNLKCEHCRRPLGIGCPHPRLSWETESDGKDLAQAAYQVRVWDDGTDGEPLWDSGKINSSRQHEVTYSGAPLQIRSSYVWRVKVWLDDGTDSDWSEAASFETGFFSLSDWKAAWFAYSGWGQRDLYCGKQSMNYLRKEFGVNDVAQLKRARAYVASTAGYWRNDTMRMNLYELRVNGARVGTDYLNPGQLSYDKKRALYRAFDLTGLLNEGANAIGLLFASHKVSIQVLMEYKDGRIEVLPTGEGWQKSNRPGAFVRLWDRDVWELGGRNEIYDAREEFTGWDQPGFDVKNWGNPRGSGASVPWSLGPQMQSAEVYGVFKPQKITKCPDNSYVVDFGHNMNGHVGFKVGGPRGTQVTLRFSETVKPDGSIHPASTYSWQGSVSTQKNIYIKRGDEMEEYAPHFAHFGFRYVEVTGWPGDLNPDDLYANAVCSAVGKESSFDCTDERVMQLHKLSERTFLSNIMSAPTDCPTRERMGWPADAAAVSTAECAMFDMRVLYEHWLNNVMDEQTPDGNLPFVVPSEQTLDGTDLVYNTCYLVVAWDSFMASGDCVSLARYYELFRRWADYALSLQESNGLSKGHYIFGDWLMNGDPDQSFLENVYTYRTLGIVANMAEVLGSVAEASKYRGHAHALHTAINAHYLNDGVYGKGTQSEIVHALVFRLVSDEMRAGLFAQLCRDLDQELCFRTGILSTPLLMCLLADEGRNDLAWKLAMSEKLGAWRYWIIKYGATTALESWNAGDRETREDKGNHTWNHPAFAGGIAIWLYRDLAGIKPLAPGYETVRIAPFMPEGVGSASAKIQTPFGPVKSAWTREGKKCHLDVEIPVGVKAEVHLPGIPARRIGSGRHQFHGTMMNQP
jgi:alpha-L-rhamnosidase